MSDLDRDDSINAIALKLSAMLALTSGEPGETFRRLSDDIQGNYMWACADMARELMDLVLGADAEKLESNNG